MRKTFGQDVEWHFFATIHGEITFDASNVAAKKTIPKTNLQRPSGSQISTINENFTFCTQVLGQKIRFFLTSTEEIEETEQQHKEMFKGAKRIPGAQTYHKFISVSQTQIMAYHMPDDSKGELKDVTGNKENLNACKNVKVGTYVA